MAGFEVSLQEISSASLLLGDVGEGLRSEMTALCGEVDSLVSGSWRGAAASGFGAEWTEWESAARDAIGALETMSGLLRASGDGYAQGDTASDSGVLSAGQALL